jgi:glucosamine--fructose-6-phosphate aminotransferase (isomerizing)
MYLGSDATPMAPYAQGICYLHEDDWVVLSRDTVSIYNAGRPVSREVKGMALSSALIGKANYRHFMLKEIAEQPDVIADTIRAFFDPMRGCIQLPALPVSLAKISRLTIVACGTAYLAGFVAKYWLERIAQLPVELDIASEFRYREAPMCNDGATLVISQSGETADTLAALRYAKEQGQKVLAVLNVSESTIGREADAVLHTLAGPEIGVASTKAFTTQLVVLAALAIATARARGVIDARREAELSVALAELPAHVAEVLARDAALKALAPKLAECRDVLFLGRGSSYPIALEGALKLKEISYIHAEGYAAGEMKHGPIALIDDKVPVVVLAPSDYLFEKTASNVEEVRARGGRVILLSDRAGIARLRGAHTTAIELPAVHPFVAPILYAIPLQLLAYYVAAAKGTDVDQPRNLAKSVTVE